MEDKLVQLFESGQYELMYQLMLATDTKIDSDSIKLHKLLDNNISNWSYYLYLTLYNGQSICITRDINQSLLNIHISMDSDNANNYFHAVYRLAELFGKPDRVYNHHVKTLNLTEQQVIEYIFHFLYLDDG